uniref:Putative ovule protein n=1 Tax=Solanum chacoense TaxID=4108 RepID=A0A0V0H1Z7_SOLCH
MCYLPVEEALSLSLGIKKYRFSRKKTLSSRVLSPKSKTIETRGNLSKPRTQISYAFPEKRTVQRSLGSAGYMKPHNFPNFRKLNPA